MTGMWKRRYGEVTRHRQTKGAATDKPNLLSPRHVSTLPDTATRSMAMSGGSTILMGR